MEWHNFLNTMFYNCTTPQQRLASWREFRHSFPKDGTVYDLLQSFESVKYQPRYIDYYTPESWPNVFDIVSEGHFCQSGITLVMAASLLHLDFLKTDALRFDIVNNHLNGSEGLVLRHEDLYYNFIPGVISTAEYVKENGLVFDSHIITTDKLFA